MKTDENDEYIIDYKFEVVRYDAAYPVFPLYELIITATKRRYEIVEENDKLKVKLHSGTETTTDSFFLTQDELKRLEKALKKAQKRRWRLW